MNVSLKFWHIFIIIPNSFEIYRLSHFLYIYFSAINLVAVVLELIVSNFTYNTRIMHVCTYF